MNNITEKYLRKPKEKPVAQRGRYEIFNLSDNPFPAAPFVNQYDKDARYNGSIYEDSIRQDEFDLARTNFLTVPQDSPNHLRLGYIMDTSYIGRGNGKSAFLINLQREINVDFGFSISDGLNKCFAIIISPEPGGRTKTFYSFVDLIAEGVFKSEVISDSLAALRLEAILQLHENFDIESNFMDEEDLRRKLNSANWYVSQQIDFRRVNEQVLSNNYLQGLPPDFPLRRSPLIPEVVENETFRQYYFDLKRGKPRLEFFFSHLVSLFLAAGFTGAYVFVDDFERIPDFQSERQKRDFALELRSCLFDGLYTNTRYGFYTFLLVLHAGVPRLVQKAWDESGLERRAPIFYQQTPKHVIRFEKISHEDANLLVKRYLREYRLKPMESDSLSPFTKKAITRMADLSELNAAEILKKAYESLEKAADLGVEIIDADFLVGDEESVFTSDKGPKGIHEEVTKDLIQKAKK